MTGQRSTPTIELYDGDRCALRSQFELAEDSAALLDAYLPLGRVLVARIGPDIVGHLQVVPTEHHDSHGPDHPAVGMPVGTAVGTPEIRNMAVLTAYQGQGIGQALIKALIDLIAAESPRVLLVATAAAGIGNLRFYQRCGFRLRSIERDAFTEAAGYPPGILLDGIALRDRVWLDLDLPG
ncbi:GNAT family N-acetyltransferase [Frankia sp. Ag45/Mut15]|uniref:GNAT family N-acetyltransferase n=1 Tax=Frankia umida TaxID=573489 RepID=A0ABT0JWB7_9ACTN|nr:GNAT family N-acetyltransferase [Frankia umida]MCK9875831.1 GNAT family N-acetyltransferase [Frankia umida]